MLFGYNTNVPYKGKMYHVQTEDTGPDKSTLVTLLYHEGAILRSKKTSYADLVGVPDFENSVRNRMKEQHKEMLKGLIAGKFDDYYASAPVTEEGPLPRAETLSEAQPEALSEIGSGGEIGAAAELPGSDAVAAPEEKKAEKKRSPGRSGKSLDDILLEHISRKVKE